ncbi:hypothetical protein G6F40_012350 [Rhizopus arrhizus]|nr:hypothetical protein G6F40_012350 [Rhizopus arrhizus]
MPVVDAPKKRTRAKPRKLAVQTSKVNVWDVLSRTNAGASVADLLAVDRTACKDLVDGVRYLRQGKRTAAVGSTGPHRNGSSSVPMVVDTVQPTDTDWSSVGTDGNEDSWSEGSSVDFSVSDVDSQVSSVYRYPYSLDNMKGSSPFKGLVSINGRTVECVFDSGASVSVISGGLASKLGLVPSNDELWLSGFDSRTAGKPSKVVVDVPVVISGCLRPEHMCILERTDQYRERELCLLGVTWFKAYGIQPRIGVAEIHIPTSRGVVVHKGYTEARQVGVSKQDMLAKKERKVHFMERQVESRPERQSMVESGLPFENKDVKVEEDTEVYAVSISAVSNGAPGSSNSLDVVDQTRIQQGRDLVESYEEGIFDKLSDDEDEDEEMVPEEMKEMVESRFADCFVENSGLGKVKGFEHKIVLKPDATPVRSVPFRLTWEENEFLEKELNSMLELGIIRPSKSGAYSSPCFFVKKKDGSRRMVLDYRKLNQMTVSNAYPLPLISELLDSLGGAKFFTTMDMAFGYWQVPMAEDSIEKTGFVTKKGIYEFLVMPFGLTSAPSTFQAMMNSILGEYIGKFCLVFIDDVLIFGGDSLTEHSALVEKVLIKCKEAGLKLKKKKCSWGQSSVSYLGHEVTSDGLKPSDHNVNKIVNFDTPKNVGEVRSYLGLCSYYRAFCPNFASVAAPLQKLEVPENVDIASFALLPG